MKKINVNETIGLNEVSNALEKEMCLNYEANENSDYTIPGCCGCGCLGTSSTEDNSEANVVGFKTTPGEWKGDVRGNGICIWAEYDPKTKTYKQVDHGSRC